MNQYASVAAYTQRSGIHETDAGASTQQDLLDENEQLQKDFLFQLHKTVIGHTLGKEARQIPADMFLVIMLKTSETTRVEQNQDDHDFRIAHPVGLITMPVFLVFNHIFSLYKYFNLPLKFNAFIAIFLFFKQINLIFISTSH